MEEERNTKERTGGLRYLRYLLMGICLCVALYEAMVLFSDYREGARANETYDEIAEAAVTEDTGDGFEMRKADDREIPYPELRIDFAALKETNPDFIGWLYFEALDISYPVVQEEEVGEYINTTFEGTISKAGCIFMDVASNPRFQGYNDILFGHNMRNGSMFGNLKKLAREGGETLLEENPYIYVYTEDAVYIYEVFAYYVTQSDSRTYEFLKSDEMYFDYLDYVERMTMYRNEEVDFTSIPSLLTLSTCSGAAGGPKRLVVHAAKTAVCVAE